MEDPKQQLARDEKTNPNNDRPEHSFERRLTVLRLRLNEIEERLVAIEKRLGIRRQ